MMPNMRGLGFPFPNLLETRFGRIVIFLDTRGGVGVRTKADLAVLRKSGIVLRTVCRRWCCLARNYCLISARWALMARFYLHIMETCHAGRDNFL
jgi:hypothetical protein